MKSRLRFLLNRLRERLWVKPLAMCVLSVAAAFVARAADTLEVESFVPGIELDSIETLLTILSSSMLVIATFAVASMVSAYASASSVATPRSFALVVSDDVSQNALSTFVGAFIFSIVSLISLQNGYYGKVGRFALFALTLLVFAMVILTFVRWVDRIARLGRLGATIDRVEAATATALTRRRRLPTLGGVPVGPRADGAREVYGGSVGYVQRIDVAALQEFAEDAGAHVEVAVLPGAFAVPGRVLAYVSADEGSEIATDRVAQAFVIGDARTFDDDPRFGLVVLSEIASRALSPAVNDPGTAIDVVGTMVRLFAIWGEPGDAETPQHPSCDRVAIPELSSRDMFEDAFRAIARDGAGVVEVAIRLQKTLEAISSIPNAALQEEAIGFARRAYARAEQALRFQDDLDALRASACFADVTRPRRPPREDPAPS